MRINVERKLTKDQGVLQFIEGRNTEIDSSPENLNELKSNKKVYKDLAD